MQLHWVFVVAFLSTTTFVYSSSSDNDTGAFKLLSRTFDKCGSDPDMFSCLKVKAVNLLDRALSVESLPVSDFVTIKKDPQAKDVPLHTFKGDLQDNLPRDLTQKSTALDKMIQERLSKYLATRTVQLNMPKDIFEGRDKGPFKGYKGGKDKGGGIFLVFGAFAAMLMQLALGKLALIAGKALLVGKVALLLAGVIGLKSLMSHGHTESSQVIYADAGDHHHGGWGRSLGKTDVQDIVYRGQRPAQHSRTQ